jgi:hypothetical protein
VFHPWQHQVDAVDCVAPHHIVQIDDRHLLADIAPRRARLQGHDRGRWHRQPGRILGQIPIAKTLAGSGQHHSTGLGVAGIEGNVPAMRGGGHQHMLRRRLGVAPRVQQ